MRAALVALHEFNVRDQTPTPAIYGCVTSGSVWRFLRLTNNRLNIDSQEYYLSDAGKIVAIIVHILESV